jgi:hypothetical protein
MEWFSLRNGYVKSKAIKINGLEESCQNRLWNIMNGFLSNDDECVEYYETVNYVLDHLGELKVLAPIQIRNVIQILREHFFEKWYKSFDVIEMFLTSVYERKDDLPLKPKEYTNLFNDVLEEEKSGYRFIENQAVNITNSAELELLEEVVHSEFDTVNTHFKKAISFYADRTDPDYENSIKESISAVESICCIITGLDGANSTLGKTLKKLKDNGVIIHPALESAFSSMYGYTSDEDGIRHGGIDFANAPAEDAKYMLMSCSAFVNYLIEKKAKMLLK